LKALIIAAGYATRLYPLTKNFPKPLLEVGGKTILDHLVDQIKTIEEIDEVFLITNHKFYGQFQDWARDRMCESKEAVQAQTGVRLEVIDDGTTSNEDRLGAVGDVQFSIEERGIADDLLVCAADNILQFPLASLASRFRTNPAAHICVRVIEDPEDRKRRGIAVLGEDDRVMDFKEKPVEPASHWGAPPLYLYPRDSLGRVAEYLNGGGTADAPGHLVEWLCRVEPVFAYRIEGSVLDIGNPESLAAARAELDK
jgi:glucose-1-phosphate thymidylyltransferase